MRSLFYSLNTAIIDANWKVLKKLKWQGNACGKNSLNKLESRNCGSMCAQLLVLGGIRNLSPDIFPQVPQEEKDLCIKKTKKSKGKEKEKEKDLALDERKRVSVPGIFGYIGVQFWRMAPIILPSNFFDSLYEAHRVEEERYGPSILEFIQNQASRDQEVNDLIISETGIDLQRVFQIVEDSWIKINHHISFLGIDIAFDKRWKRRDGFFNKLQKLHKKITNKYHKLIKNYIEDQESNKVAAKEIFDIVCDFYFKWNYKASKNMNLFGTASISCDRFLQEIIFASSSKIFDILLTVDYQIAEGTSIPDLWAAHKTRTMQVKPCQLRHFCELPTATEVFSGVSSLRLRDHFFTDSRILLCKDLAEEDRTLELNVAFILSKVREKLLLKAVKHHISNKRKFDIRTTTLYLKQKFARPLFFLSNDPEEIDEETVAPWAKEVSVEFLYSHIHRTTSIKKILRYFCNFINSHPEFAAIIYNQIKNRNSMVLKEYYNIEKPFQLKLKGAAALLFSLGYLTTW